MSSKKKETVKPIITMGIHKGKSVTITKKKSSSPGNVVVNIIDGPTIEVSKLIVK